VTGRHDYRETSQVHFFNLSNHFDLLKFLLALYRAAWMQGGLVRRKLPVCLSIRLSVRQTRALWLNGRKICPDFYTTRKTIQPSFLRRRMVGGATPSTWNFRSIGPRWSEIADFQPIFVRSALAVTPSEKSLINTNNIIGNPLRPFQRA